VPKLALVSGTALILGLCVQDTTCQDALEPSNQQQPCLMQQGTDDEVLATASHHIYVLGHMFELPS
jgi:hypothetical protein